MQFNKQYDFQEISNIPIYFVKTHNLALPIWGEFSKNIRNEKLELITFDYHTDTHRPFNSYYCSQCSPKEKRNYSLESDYIKRILKNKKYKREDFCFEDVYELADKYLRNDEQILTAYDFKYIDKYTVICSDELEEQSDLDTSCRQDLAWDYDARYYTKEYIERMGNIQTFESIILDFDLDYFCTINCFNDKFEKLISNLLTKTKLITIAIEQNYFESCKKDKFLDLEVVKKRLVKMLKENILNLKQRS